MVADPDVDARIEQAVLLQNRQQQTAQGHLTGRDIDGAGLQIPSLGQLRLARLDMLEGDADVGIQPLALRRQLHAPVRPGEQRAAQLAFQIADGARQVRLVVDQLSCRLREIAAFRNIIKDPVIVIIYVHTCLL